MADQAGRLASVRVHGDHAIRYSEGGAFDAVALGERSTPVEFNSVVLVPNLLTADECAALVADVERAWSESNSQDTADRGHQRFELRALAAESQLLFEKILRDRLLPCAHLITAWAHVREGSPEQARSALEGARILEAFQIDPQFPAIFAEIRARLEAE